MSEIPKTYTVAQISEKGGKFEFVERPLRAPERGEILVKVIACGVCYSDNIAVSQTMPTGLPRVPGHEIIGDVIAVGPGEQRFKPGSRAGAGWHGGHDGVCVSCRRGDFVTCENQAITGVTVDGGYATHVILRSESAAMIPKDIDPYEAAPLLCAGMTTFNSLRNMQVKAGETVAVQGIGGLGHLAVQLARQMGYQTVALSSSDAKKELAQELGAHEYIDGSKEDHAEALQKRGGAKVIICTAPNPEIINSLMNGLAVDGTLLLLAVASEITVPMVPMVSKRLSIRGWPSGTPVDSEDTIDFATVTGIRPRIQKFAFQDAQKAFDTMITNKARFRAVIAVS